MKFKSKFRLLLTGYLRLLRTVFLYFIILVIFPPRVSTELVDYYIYRIGIPFINAITFYTEAEVQSSWDLFFHGNQGVSVSVLPFLLNFLIVYIIVELISEYIYKKRFKKIDINV